jgi:hypothetical protein
MPCSPEKVSRLFGGTCRLHLQGRGVSQARNRHEAGRADRVRPPVRVLILGYAHPYVKASDAMDPWPNFILNVMILRCIYMHIYTG